MGGQNLQAIVEAFRNFVSNRGWSISDEKEIQHGYQLTVTDGITKIPVALYSSGKALVQGKASPLQTELKAWCYGPKATPKQLDVEVPAQLQLVDTQPTSSTSGALPTKMQATGLARIGSDESGKGDYFGPLVIAAVYVDEQTESQLIALGIRDSKLLSDNNIATLAQEIKTLCQGRGTVLAYPPERYNKIYKETGNLNLLLAKAHAQVIAKIAKVTASKLAIIDQFGNEVLVRNALAQSGCTIAVEQRHRAEDDVAVAAASIIARAEFVRQLAELSRSVGMDLPKGASNPQIVTVGRQIVAKGGQQALARVAKLHFKTTETILQK